MAARQDPEVLVVGAGPVGLFAGLALAQRGVPGPDHRQDVPDGRPQLCFGVARASVGAVATLGPAGQNPGPGVSDPHGRSV